MQKFLLNITKKWINLEALTSGVYLFTREKVPKQNLKLKMCINLLLKESKSSTLMHYNVYYLMEDLP